MLATEHIWRSLALQAAGYARASSAAAERLSKTAAQPLSWHHADTGEVWDDPATPPPGFGRAPWVPVKLASCKCAEVVRPLLQAWHLAPSQFADLYGGPTPIAATLAGGLLGAGAGYLGGRAAEALFPEGVLEKGRLRRTTALLGGLLGAVPGIYTGTLGMRLRPGNSPWRAWVEPNPLFGTPDWLERSGTSQPPLEHYKGGSLEEAAEDLLAEAPEVQEDPVLVKAAQGFAGELAMPIIPVDAFNRVIWEDPFAPLPLRAATVGLVESASQDRGGAALISPLDIARIAAGAGTGLVSAHLVGKALGALAGLTPAAQQQLQRAGVFAGVLANTVPKAFGF